MFRSFIALGVFMLCEIVYCKPQIPVGLTLRYLDPNKDEGQGYDLYYYDGYSLRDEKWRFSNGDTVVNHRHGFRDLKTNLFHLVDTETNSDRISWSSTILDKKSEASILQQRVASPKFGSSNFYLNKILYPSYDLRKMAESHYTTKSPIEEIKTPCEGLVPPLAKCVYLPKDFETNNATVAIPEISITTTKPKEECNEPNCEDKEESTTFAEDDPLGNRIGENVIKSLVG